MSSKYKEVCKSKGNIPLYFNDWWLDVVCGKDGWRGYVLNSDNFTKAIWPMKVEKRKFNRRHINMPQLTPFLGIQIFYPENQKYSTRLSYEKDVINELILNIGKYDLFHQSFSPEFTNWLPFYWQGFKQTTLYTYRLNNIKSHQLLFDNFQENIRREIRKAQRAEISVIETTDFEEFFESVKKTYRRQSKKILFKETLQKIWIECSKRDCCKMFLAKDNEGKTHSTIFLVWDNQVAYYLIGGGDPELRRSGATSLLMYETIKFASEKVDCFDFEGSMIEPVERFFRAFGAIQTPYFSISKMSRKEKCFQKIVRIKERLWK